LWRWCVSLLRLACVPCGQQQRQGYGNAVRELPQCPHVAIAVVLALRAGGVRKRFFYLLGVVVEQGELKGADLSKRQVTDSRRDMLKHTADLSLVAAGKF